MPLGVGTKYIGHNESGEEDGVLEAPPLEMQQIFTLDIFFSRADARIGSRRALAVWRWHVPLSQHPGAPVYRIGISDGHWNTRLEDTENGKPRAQNHEHSPFYALEITHSHLGSARKSSARENARERARERERGEGVQDASFTSESDMKHGISKNTRRDFSQNWR